MKGFIFILVTIIFTTQVWGQSLDGSFGSSSSVDTVFQKPGGLTDQEANEAKTFVHEGRKEAVYEKSCAENDNVCNGKSAQAGIEDQIGKLYVLVFGGMGIMGGGGPSVKIAQKPDAAAGAKTGASATADTTAAAGDTSQAAGGAAKKPEADKSADYCLYGAIAGEGLATLMQGSEQNKASQEAANLNDPQLAALVQLKETHKARKKTSTYQSVVFGATAACYAARKLLQPAVVMDAQYMIKMAAAAGISALYMKKAAKHADAMKKIQKVIDSLPKAGDCNPWTGTSCFCKEPTSASLYPGQYQEVCMLNNGIADGPKDNMGCGTVSNNIVTLDQDCKCKQSNTCFGPILKFPNPSIGLGANFLSAANTGYSLLDPSQFDEGKLKDYSNAAAALNNKLKPNLANVPDATLTPAQQKVADDLKDVVPPAVANMAAGMNSSGSTADGQMNSGLATSVSGLPAALKKQVGASEVSGNYRSSGGTSEVGGAGDSTPAFTMPGMGQQAPTGGTEVLSFADKAMKNAEISNRPDTPIFDIISNRYRSSGWNRLK
jgi:hypothetical protein